MHPWNPNADPAAMRETATFGQERTLRSAPSQPVSGPDELALRLSRRSSRLQFTQVDQQFVEQGAARHDSRAKLACGVGQHS